MQPSTKIKVIIANDKVVVREGLTIMLNRQKDVEVVAQTAKLSELPDLFRHHRPSVLLIDLRMAGIDTIDTIRQLKSEFPNAAILMVSDTDGSEDIYRSLRAGAKGYVLKDLSDVELMEAIYAVNSGRKHISPPIAAKLAERMDRSTLTEREHQVLQWIVKGKSNKEIADILNVTEGTVKFHVNGILTKLGVTDRTQAATAALLRGIIHPQDL